MSASELQLAGDGRLPLELLARGQHTMTVCNACRYCEAYCPVFQAMEDRRAFGGGDLSYLASLCHQCGECLYACPFAPPHEFAIQVPRTLAEIRLASYEQYCWPRPLAAAFRRQPWMVAIATVLGTIAILAVASAAGTPGAMWSDDPRGQFYEVVPHAAMVSLFGAAFGFAALVMGVGCVRFWRDASQTADDRDLGSAGASPSHPVAPSRLVAPSRRAVMRAVACGLFDAATLRHMQSAGDDCTSDLEARRPWRRWFHHATFYGFLLCFASTTVAAIYHLVFGWHAPHAYLSLPVLLGAAGGVGLVVGPLGLLAARRTRDTALGDPEQGSLDLSLIALLLLVSASGLLLLALRDTRAMGMLLIAHLGCVLALAVLMPYGKFVHAIYRTAALVKFALEQTTGPNR